ncbi:butyrophilin subfamily 2 member A1-like [Centropristis striata]|uniref:butyrophilin subfamily 2 member A1-like n=1 Tax=Centropristis striata TaxID=184440 RepID=UPI0027DF3C8F|nr:butyrophilin subfamily 2 member A1-like [Centropristis striata]
MNGHLFLVAFLVCFCCAGEALEDGVPVEILTAVGHAVTLPCSVTVSNHQIPSVEWSKKDLKPKPIVFLYRSGCETFEEKNPSFHYRTNLFMNELKNGNVSLRLSDVQLSDSGTYICKQNQIKGPPREVLRVKLTVGVVSEPKLSVVPAAADDDDDGVTLQCEAICWFPQPVITFHDALGNTISARDPKNYQDPRGCFNITKRATVKNSNSISKMYLFNFCIIFIIIPDDCMKSCTIITATAASLIAIIIILASCASNVYLYKKWKNSGGGHKLLKTKLSNDSSISNASTEHLREIAELKSNLHDKEEIIGRLTGELIKLRSNQSLVVCGHGGPAIDSSPSKSSPDVSKPISSLRDKTPHNNDPRPAASTSSYQPNPDTLPKIKDSKPAVSFQIPALGSHIQKDGHNHSSPALFPDFSAGASSLFAPEKTHLGRSKSVSESPNKLAQVQRRCTISFPSNNRFNPLAKLSEDEVEQLL